MKLKTLKLTEDSSKSSVSDSNKKPLFFSPKARKKEGFLCRGDSTGKRLKAMKSDQKTIETQIIRETVANPHFPQVSGRTNAANSSLRNFDNVDLRQSLQKPKPFVKWVGGKRQLIRQFSDLGIYPPKNFNPLTGTYFEPFLGGGAVFFDLLPNQAELSDLNYELVAAYNAVKSDVEAVIISLKKHQHSKDYFLQIRKQKIENTSEAAGEIARETEIASRLIYLNRTGFNGLYRVNKKGEFNVPFGRYENPLICDENNLRLVSKSLQNVLIAHRDYKEVLSRVKKGDFVYFDPPYLPLSKTSSFTSYTSQTFLEKEQVKLCETFAKLHKKGCFVMLSNSGAEFIEKIYLELPFARVLRVEAGRAINSKATGRGKIAEFVITNY